MNDTDYGLTAAVYTQTGRARSSCSPGATRAPSTGTAATASARGCRGADAGHSGIGSTLSTYGIETFTRPKAWHLRSA